MTYQDRLLKMLLDLGWKAPGKIQDHAVERWLDRWRGGTAGDRGQGRRELTALVDRAVIRSISYREKASVWSLPVENEETGDAPLIVVAHDGAVVTVLPKGSSLSSKAERRTEREVRRKMRAG